MILIGWNRSLAILAMRQNNRSSYVTDLSLSLGSLIPRCWKLWCVFFSLGFVLMACPVLSSPREDFIGLWWVSHGDGAPLQLRLYRDASAWSDFPSNNPGSWTFEDSEALVRWADGWKELLAFDLKGAHKFGFEPGREFIGLHSNSSRAYHVCSRSDGWFGFSKF